MDRLSRLAGFGKLCVLACAVAGAALGGAPGCASSTSEPAVPGQHTTADHRTVFVQLFEWPWPDIARECEDYLGPHGFAAVQISPPNEHAWIATGDGAPLPWWMRYQPVSYRLDRSRSGTRAEFIDMVRRCAAAGVAIFADAVINHMAAGAGTASSDGDSAWSDGSFPRVPYAPADFHPACEITSYQDAASVQRCWLVGLPDLDTGAAAVRARIVDYLVELAALGVRGFRIDAAKHISARDLDAIIGAVNARATAPLFWFLEVIGATGEAVQPRAYFQLADHTPGSERDLDLTVTEFGYGPALSIAFGSGGMLAPLRTLGERWGLMPSHKAVVFTDNHDKQRGHAGGGAYLTYHAGAAYTLANVFMLAWPYGNPVVMSSYAFKTSSAFDTSHGPPHDPATGATLGPWRTGSASPACFDQTIGGWVCEHRFHAIGNMVAFRNSTLSNWTVTDWWDNGRNQIAFGRGDRGFVVINLETAALSRTFRTQLAAGRYCDILSGDFIASPAACSGAVITVDAHGMAAITAAAMSASAIHAGAVIAEPM